MTHSIHQDRELDIDLAELPPVLEPLVKALEQKDYGLISDLLLFEMQPLLMRWSDQLETSSGADSTS